MGEQRATYIIYYIDFGLNNAKDTASVKYSLLSLWQQSNN